MGEAVVWGRRPTSILHRRQRYGLTAMDNKVWLRNDGCGLLKVGCDLGLLVERIRQHWHETMDGEAKEQSTWKSL